MPLKALRKVFLWTVIVLGGFYAFTIIYLMMNEESMIFFPSSSIVVTPADSGWQYREIEFSAENSITINGWKIEGKSIADSLPVILYLHGNGGNISYNMAVLSVLRQLAKEVYAFDYRGYGKSTGNITAEGYTKDCRDMMNYLLREENISPSDLIIHGHSIGAYGAALLAAEYEIKGLVMEGAFTSVPDIAAEIYRILPVKAVMSVEFNNLAIIKDLQLPILFIHAEHDHIIPVHHGETLYVAANEPKEILILGEGGHSDGLILNRQLVVSKYANFFR